MTKDEALKMALEALEYFRDTGTRPSDLAMSEDAITAIKEALAQPEQEHFALKHRIAELEGAVIGLQAQLAQPEQEPVGWFGYDQGTRIWFETNKGEDNSVPLFTAPPQRTWVGLTDEEIYAIYGQAEVLVHDSWVGNGTVGLMFPITLYKMFEAKLKEKNT